MNMKASPVITPSKRGSLSSQAKYRLSVKKEVEVAAVASAISSSAANSSGESPNVSRIPESGRIGIDLYTDSECSEAVDDSVESNVPKRYPKHYLLILDLNGVLVAREFLGSKKPDGPQFKTGERIGAFWGWKRPGLEEFLDFVFEHFHVAIWSSVMKKNIDQLAEFALGSERYAKLLFVFDQTYCHPEVNPDDAKKPLFLKNLTEVWKKFPEHGQDTTIIVDDNEKKLKYNHPNNVVVVETWDPSVKDDTTFQPGGELFEYLYGLIYDINKKYIR
jgi:hypothetical protein